MKRRERATLAQLRTGFCSSLNDYQHRINAAPSALCPCCREMDHTVRHLFQCRMHPTTLAAADLWRRPERVLEFLRTWPCFSALQRERPPPEPPPPNQDR